MAGIESYGVALPDLRLPASAYVEAWGSCGARGMKRKAVCAYDEDAVTLAIEASRRALRRLRGEVRIDGLFFGVTTPPYDEKPSAATLATALFADTDLRVTEISGSPQAGMQALLCALEYCAANPGSRALAVAGDAPTAPPDAPYEHALGAGAAAFVVGDDSTGDAGVAELAAHYAVTRETFGSRFRRHGAATLSDLELRTRDQQASLAALAKAADAAHLTGAKHIALGADAGVMRGAARALGNSKANVDGLWSEIGDAGAASAMLALAGALDRARAGETVFAAAIGAGATAAVFTIGKGLAPLRRRGEKLDKLIARGTTIDYVSYLKHRRMLSSRTGGTG
jgi:hydroxymethylglutaryl-CoA synthase